MRSYVQSRPKDPQGQLNLANVLWSLERHDEAIEPARIAAEESGLPEYVLEYASKLEGMDRGEEAFEVRKQAVVDHPDHARAHWNLARELITRGLYSEWREHALQAIELDPASEEA